MVQPAIDENSMPPKLRFYEDDGGRAVPVASDVDLYYWYYAGLTLFQQGGDGWKLWNDIGQRMPDQNQLAHTGTFTAPRQWPPIGGA